MSAPDPELGQLLFSNSGHGDHVLPDYVEDGIAMLGALIAASRGGGHEHDPTQNVGPDADFQNDVFVMLAYCWCEGDKPGHENGCPPNFIYGDLSIWWYKHSGRSATASHPVPWQQWTEIMRSCLASLAA